MDFISIEKGENLFWLGPRVWQNLVNKKLSTL